MNGTMAISGEEGFFALAKALAAFKAVQLRGDPSDRALAKAVQVSATTVGDWLRGERFPQQIDVFLKLVGMVSAEAAARGVTVPDNGIPGLLDERRWREAYLAETRRRGGEISDAMGRAQAAQVLTVTPIGWPLGEVRDPFALEVHRPVQPDAPQPDLPVLPVYVPREHDDALARVVRAAVDGTSGIAVLVGGSSTGKTRACWEALQLLRDQITEWRLWHPIDPSRPDAALRDLPAIGPRTVVWLNEAQFYLDAAGGLGEQLAAGLRELLRDRARGPVLVLATLWPQFWDDLTSRPAGGEDPHAQARELLGGHDIPVASAFTSAQVEQLRKSGDVRLTHAARAAQDGQVTQFLAGAPELLARYRNAPPAAGALLNATMDARRLGMGHALSHAFLEAAAPGYLSDSEWDQLDEDLLEQALAYSAKPCKGVRGPLTRIRARPASPPNGCGVGPVYQLADYLDQHGRVARREQMPPAVFWAAVASDADPGDLRALARAAYNRGLYRDSAQLYKNAAAHGDTYAAAELVHLMHRLHPGDDLAARWAAAYAHLDDWRGVANLLGALQEAGAGEQAEALAARAATQAPLDDPEVVANLVGALREAGAGEQAEVLGARAAAYAPIEAPFAVAWLLGALQKGSARELAVRAAAQAPLDHPLAVARLVDALRKAGAAEQAEVLAVRAAAHAPLDNPDAVGRLVDALRKEGATEQAEVLAARAAAHAPLDKPGAVAYLMGALGEAGAGEEVEVLAARAAAHAPLDDPGSVTWLLKALREAGAEEQVEVLMARDPGTHAQLHDPFAVASLLDALWQVCAGEQAEVLANRAAAHAPLDDAQAVARLVGTLQQVGRRGQAEVLAVRAAAHAPVNSLEGSIWLQCALQEKDAGELVSALAARATFDDWFTASSLVAVTSPLGELLDAREEKEAKALAARVAARAPLDDPLAVAWLLGALGEVGADQVRLLVARDPAAHARLDEPGPVAGLLDELREAGAREQIRVLVARDPAAHTRLDDPEALARLVGALREVGAGEQAESLAARAARHATLDNPEAVTWLLKALREAGAGEQAKMLAARAASQAPVDDPSAVAKLLRALQDAGAGEQVQVLVARSPATQARLDVSFAVESLLAALREVGAREQAEVLAVRAAAGCAPFDPFAAESLLAALREVGARDQAEVLAARAATQAPLDPDIPRVTASLLAVLRALGEGEQAEVLTDRLPRAGMFKLFCEREGYTKRFSFGREVSGSPAEPWGWETWTEGERGRAWRGRAVQNQRSRTLAAVSEVGHSQASAFVTLR